MLIGRGKGKDHKLVLHHQLARELSPKGSFSLA
jgi:hypothetical protein